jgi:hypothetical protein
MPRPKETGGFLHGQLHASARPVPPFFSTFSIFSLQRIFCFHPLGRLDCLARADYASTQAFSPDYGIFSGALGGRALVPPLPPIGLVREYFARASLFSPVDSDSHRREHSARPAMERAVEAPTVFVVVVVVALAVVAPD